MIAVVILFIIVIILLIALLKPILNMKGGAYHLYKNGKKNLIISPSEQLLLSHSFKTIAETIEESTNIFKLQNEVNVNNEIFTLENVQGRMLSDSCIDGIIFHKNFHAEHTYSICEFNSDLIRHENGIRSIQGTGSNMIKHFNGTDIKIDTELSLKEEMEEFILNNPSNISIFIDFSYPRNLLNVGKAYKNVHEKINNICSLINFDIGKNIYIFKYIMNERGDLISDRNDRIIDIRNDDLHIIGITNLEPFNNRISRQTQIEVPTTNDRFFMDEYIHLKTSTNNISIQIEHSEDYNNHKSNAVEFILRECNNGSSIVENKYFSIIRNIYLRKIPYPVIDTERNRERRKCVIKQFHNLINHDYNMIEDMYDCFENEEIANFISSPDLSNADLCIFTLMRFGYRMNENKFISARGSNYVNIHKRSPIYLAWPDFADNYFNIQ